MDTLEEVFLLGAGLLVRGLVTPWALGVWAAALAFDLDGFGEEELAFFLEAAVDFPVTTMVGSGG